jgi:hypothetical protein
MFVHTGTFYQILRIEQSKSAHRVPPTRPSESSVVTRDDAHLEAPEPCQSLTLSFGGEVRFGCGNARQDYHGCNLGSGKEVSGTQDHSNALGGEGDIKSKVVDSNKVYLVESTPDGKRLSRVCEAHSTRMDMQLFINQTLIALSGSPGAYPKTSQKYAYIGTEYPVPLGQNPSTVILAISLQATGKPMVLDKVCSWDWVAEYLGVNYTWRTLPGQMWEESYKDRLDDEDGLDNKDRLEMEMVACCVERALIVTSVPRMSQNPAAFASWPDGRASCDSTKNAEQVRTTEGPEDTEEAKRGRPNCFRVLKQYVDTDILKKLKIDWEEDQVGKHPLLC